MLVRFVSHGLLVLQFRLKHLREHVLGVTIARRRHLSPLQLALEYVLLVVHRLVLMRLIFVLFEALIVNTVMHGTRVVVRGGTSIPLSQLILALLEVNVDLAIVLDGWLLLLYILYLISSHFLSFSFFNSIYND